MRADLDSDTVLWARLNGLLSVAWRPAALRVDGDEIDLLGATYIAALSDGLRR